MKVSEFREIIESYRKLKELCHKGFISEDTCIKASIELLDTMLIKYDNGDPLDKVY